MGAFEDRNPMTLYDWTEQKRIMAKDTPRPGRWDHNTAPYLKEIFHAYDDPETSIIVLMLASQTGKSELINNMKGHLFSEAPCPAISVFPKDEMAYRYARIRLARMFEDMPFLLDNFINANHSKKSDGKTLIKVFLSGFLLLSGANSPSNLASWPVQKAFLDELDRMTDSAGGEGDVVELVMKRLTNFFNTMLVLSSTPTTEDGSKIAKHYNASSSGKCYVPCPLCKELILFKIESIKIESTGAFHECPKCRKNVPESERRPMVEKHKWVHANPDNKKSRGFTISALYSLFGTENVSWKSLWDEYKACQFDEEKKKVFYNTRLALPYGTDVFESLDWQAMFKAKTEKFKGPKDLCLITAAFDVQKDRIEYEIHYWGKKFECHPYKYGKIKGDPLYPTVWNKLKKVMEKKYPWGGKEFHIDAFCGDTGYLPDHVFAFIKSFKASRKATGCPTIASGIRGVATGQTIIRFAPDSEYTDRRGKKKKRKARYLCNTNIAKDILYKAIKNSIDHRVGLTDTRPPGHYFVWANEHEDYYRQVCAEESYQVIRDGRPQIQYRKRNDAKANEVLDLWVYNLAMAHKYLKDDLEDEAYWDLVASRRKT